MRFTWVDDGHAAGLQLDRLTPDAQLRSTPSDEIDLGNARVEVRLVNAHKGIADADRQARLPRTSEPAFRYVSCDAKVPQT